MRLLSWMPPSAATFIYSVCLKPKPVRAVAQWLVKRIIPSRLTVDGIVLVMNQDDAIVCGALTLGCYETFPRRLFRDLLKPGMTVVDVGANIDDRSEEHTSELQSQSNLVCRLLLEKKKKKQTLIKT